MRNPIAQLIGLTVSLTAVHPVTAAHSQASPVLPLLHFDKLESYGQLQMVAPTGYFEIARRFVHAPRVEWQPVAGAASYQLILLQNGKVLGTTKARSSPHFVEKGWKRTRPGKANIVIEAYDADGNRIALSRLFPFYVAPGFNEKAAAKQKRGYADAAWAAFQALYNYQPPANQPLPTNSSAGQIKPVLLAAFHTRAHMTGISFPRFKQAGLQMAETLLRTQLEDGSWPARVDGRTGAVIAKYSTSVAAALSLFERVNGMQPDLRWSLARDKSLAWMEKFPMRSYGWVVNYDDIPAGADAVNPYVGLSNWDLFHFIRYLCGHPARMTNTAARIREQLDWNDNHFVFYGDDPLLPFKPFYPTCGEQGNPASFASPSGCWVPMDFHTANWGRALLRTFELTGDRKFLRIARAAANAITQYQLDDGRTITWMPDRDYGLSAQINGTVTQDFWPGGWAMAATLWAELAALEKGAPAVLRDQTPIK